ncbi:hypothetical protein HN011_010997 [Eciton burchellii]|nr:hypothetical protein HN011_010997 [Eciton burchellii]
MTAPGDGREGYRLYNQLRRAPGVLQESGKPTINREKAIRNRSRRCEDGTFNFSNIAIMMTATRTPIAKSIPKGIVASQRSEKNSKRKDPRTSQMISAGITMRQRII